MNLAHLHLILNHLPIVALPLTAVFLLVGILRQNKVMKKTSLLMLFFVGLVNIPVYFTGEPAEKVIEDVPSVTEAVIEPHEDAAMYALIVVSVTALLAGYVSIASLDDNKKNKAEKLILFLALFGSVVLARTGYLGGQIRHTEARPASQPAK